LRGNIPFRLLALALALPLALAPGPLASQRRAAAPRDSGPASVRRAPERRARERIPVDVAVEDAADVWSRRDGTGYANDIVRAAFRAAGYEPVLHPMPYARCKAALTRSQVPVCFSMSRDPSIAPWIAFSDSANFVFTTDFYHAVAHPLPGQSPAQLRRGTVVGAVLGYEYPDTVYRLARRGVIRLEYANSETINLRKLADGRLDAALVNTDSTKRTEDLVARAGVTHRVAVAFRAGMLPGFVGFSLRHPMGAELRARYNAGRRLIATNGTLAAIKSRWADSVRAKVRPPARTARP